MSINLSEKGISPEFLRLLRAENHRLILKNKDLQDEIDRLKEEQKEAILRAQNDPSTNYSNENISERKQHLKLNYIATLATVVGVIFGGLTAYYQFIKPSIEDGKLAQNSLQDRERQALPDVESRSELESLDGDDPTARLRNKDDASQQPSPKYHKLPLVIQTSHEPQTSREL